MDETVEFELVSPEKLLLSKAVEMVVVPGMEGDFGVLPRHAPLLSTIRPGVIRVYEGGQVVEQIFVAGGFVEVTGQRCTVLAEEALPVSEIDRAAVERHLSDRRDDLLDAKNDDERTAIVLQITVAEVKLQVSA